MQWFVLQGMKVHTFRQSLFKGFMVHMKHDGNSCMTNGKKNCLTEKVKSCLLCHLRRPSQSLHEMVMIFRFSVLDRYRNCWMQTPNLDTWKGFQTLLDYLPCFLSESVLKPLGSLRRSWRMVLRKKKCHLNILFKQHCYANVNFTMLLCVAVPDKLSMSFHSPWHFCLQPDRASVTVDFPQ